ncbi:MAG: thiamine phosphate synthase [Deltaproteobacteria bacterium]|nr:thiamine phosphate synthase [Deltaproteobacteria bacterium]
MSAPLSLDGFYAICDLPPPAGEVEARELCGRLLRGGARALQLRHKHAPAGVLLECARAVAPLCRAAGVPFIVNDRLDVALLAGADAVHLGQEDLPLAAARRLAPGLRVGVSTHNLEQARAAAAAGADYLGFGPVFATATKEHPDPVVGLEGLRAACAAVGVPVVAIGGLTAGTAGAAIAAGAAAVAVIGAVVEAEDVEAAAREVTAAVAKPLKVEG